MPLLLPVYSYDRISISKLLDIVKIRITHRNSNYYYANYVNPEIFEVFEVSKINNQLQLLHTSNNVTVYNVSNK